MSDRVRLLDDFREDTFHTHFFNAQQIQIPLLCRISVNMSVKFLDAYRVTQQVGSCVLLGLKISLFTPCGPILL